MTNSFIPGPTDSCIPVPPKEALIGSEQSFCGVLISFFVARMKSSSLMCGQVHGLDLRSILSGGVACFLAAPDVSQFRRLQSLHLDGVNKQQLIGNSWQLLLPSTLRVLHLDRHGAKDLQVTSMMHSHRSTRTESIMPRPLC